MSERTDDLTRDVEDEAVGVSDESDVDGGLDGHFGLDDSATLDDTGGFDTAVPDFGADSDRTTASTEADGDTGGLRGRVDGVFSLPAFAIQLLGALAGIFVIGGAVPFGPLSGVFGILVALFGLGVVATDSRYVEAGVAGTLVGALTTVFTSITLSVVSGGLLPVAGGLAGGAAALLGHYLGRDLRDGLTRDL